MKYFETFVGENKNDFWKNLILLIQVGIKPPVEGKL